MMWHMGLRLPWCWRLGPSDSSERRHVTEMLDAEAFPKNTLFCADAGFIGYPFWSSLIERGNDFLVRVGNVNLLRQLADCTIEKKGKCSLVYCWPKAMMKSGQPPLKLRLALVVLRGKTRVWLLTSVLDKQRLPIKQMQRFYEMRWGIEVEFLKQTLDHAKLRCRNNQRLLAELDWSMMAMTFAELFALKEQLAKRASKSDKAEPPNNPAKRSLAETMRALRDCMRNPKDFPEPGEDLTTQLRNAVMDCYIRKKSKQSRYRRPNPDKKPLGDPKLRNPTAKEKEPLERAEARKTQ